MSDGATFFLRCAACFTLYEPACGLDVTTGTRAMYWTRPRPRRGTRTQTVLGTPIACDHRGAIERWDGTTWVPCVLHEKERKP